MSSKALDLYWSNVKSFTKSNWKYALSFGIGSLITSICSIFIIKKVTGWSTFGLIFNYLIAKEKSKYRDVIKYPQFSKYPSPIRPSTDLMGWDSFFRKQPRGNNYKTTEKEFLSTFMKYRKQNLSIRSPRYGLPKYVETPKDVIIKDKSVNNQGALICKSLIYPGAKIENGVILYIHGGGFFLGFPEQGYGFLSIMAQYLGMIVYAIDHHYCPEISIPQQVDECIDAYMHILNVLKVNSKKVFICGDSSGASLCLLTLQKLNKLGIPQPCGGISISPQTDLTGKTALNTEQNDGIKDAMFDICPAFAAAICIDKNDLEIESDKVKILSDGKYSCLNGDWKGLCPLYISASENEVLINDSKLILDKCKEFNVDYEYDFDPYLLHCPVSFASVIPESRDKLIIVIEWMKKQLKLQNS